MIPQRTSIVFYDAGAAGERQCCLKVLFTFSNFVADVVAVFMFVLWLWLLITVSSDLFRRH
jgi:hypothetical protein